MMTSKPPSGHAPTHQRALAGTEQLCSGKAAGQAGGPEGYCWTTLPKEVRIQALVSARHPWVLQTHVEKPLHLHK